ncbi:phage tail tape measure protein [Microbacterium sp. SORGH_AS_0888]|uniref:phage tail tape measure protein n=1 Tax=Microbacterium sp. SORGH_AS_0888 TaxID=3041791 RepID=UPI00277D64AA|nr:phage tail tape measure protein [Microbacterium sp. SORGH_AS_0888]MDQ1130247.1 TP901 family phage tail tape measure protein [Microbacterium sp. SORGH_AS_0888]
MADRVVKVTLSAQVAEYKKGMLEAAQATRTVGTEGEKLAQSRAAFDAVGKAGVAMGAVIAAGVGVAIAKFAEFDAAMSNVEAATGETAENMDALRKAAIDAGASTVFSATDAAGAIEELAKAGLSTQQILTGGLNGALALAAAGQMSVADAAQTAAIATKQFALEGKDVPHVADLLAAGAGKAVGDVSDLSQALNQAGLVAHGAGQSIEDTTGVLAAFADAGLLGSDAGTSLKTAIIALQAPTDKSRAVMDQYGLSFYDGTGKMLSFTQIAGQLQTKLGGLSDEQRNAALAQVFGNDALRSANVLYQQGAAGIQRYIDQTNDAGYAAEQARKRLDNLRGDLEALSGALDSALIQTGSGANETLRTVTQALTGLVQMYSDLPEPVQHAVLAIGGVTAAVALAGGTAMLAVPKFIELKATIDGAGISMKSLGLSAGGAGLALAGLLTIVVGIAQKQAEARAQAQAQAYADTLEDGTLRVTEATKKLAAENLSKTPGMWDNLFGKISGPGSVLDSAEKLHLSLSTVTDAAVGSSKAIEQLSPYLKRIREDSGFAADEANRLGLSQQDLERAALKVQSGVQGEADSLDEAARLAKQKEQATQGVTDATEKSAQGAQSAAQQYLAEGDAVDNLASELDKLVDQINKANGVGQDAITKNIDYQDAVAKLDEQIRKATEGTDGYATTLDVTTQAGRDNMDLIVDLAEKSQAAAKAQFDLDSNTDAYRATLEAGRQALIDRATQLGYNTEQATALADQIYRIPSQTEWNVIANTAAATTEMVAWLNQWQGRTVTLEAVMSAQPAGYQQIFGPAPNANGGLYDYTSPATAYAPGDLITLPTHHLIPLEGMPL